MRWAFAVFDELARMGDLLRRELRLAPYSGPRLPASLWWGRSLWSSLWRRRGAGRIQDSPLREAGLVQL